VVAPALAIEITEAEILSKLRNFEDSFVERKRFSEASDWLRTAVAFANSTPIGYPSILFIGIKNDGTIEDATDLDALQKRLSGKLERAYPPIYYWTKVLRENSKQFLAVIIPGSDKRPHFSGRAYVRVESQTKDASETQMVELISSRNDKVREILRWKDKAVTVDSFHPNTASWRVATEVRMSHERFVRDCNAFYVTISESLIDGSSHWSHPLNTVNISFDNNYSRLRLQIRVP
jgi:hypothetical protein